MNFLRKFPPAILPPSLALLSALWLSPAVVADDGYRLWLRYESLPPDHRPPLTALVAPGESGAMDAIRKEIATAIPAMLGKTIPSTSNVENDGDGLFTIGNDLIIIPEGHSPETRDGKLYLKLTPGQTASLTYRWK